MRTVSQEHLGGVELGILQRFILALIIALSVPSFAAEANLTSPNPSEERSVQLSGVSLFYESFGPAEGETVLLISGTGMQLTAWPKELIDGLVQRGYRVVRFDNRDTGRSTTFEEEGWPDFEAVFAAMGAGLPLPLPYTIDDMVEDAVGLLDALGIEKAHIVGMSMGGTIAQLMAADHPSRVRSLTSIAADSGNPVIPVAADPEALAVIPPLYPGITKEEYIDRQVTVGKVIGSPDHPVDEATLRRWAERDVERGFSPGGEARQGAAVLVAHFIDRTAKLKSIKAPTVILHGADDPLVPVESARDLAAKIPGADLRFVPGMGHDIPAGLVPTFVDAILAAASR